MQRERGWAYREEGKEAKEACKGRREEGGRAGAGARTRGELGDAGCARCSRVLLVQGCGFT